MRRALPLLILTGCPWIGPELHDNNSPNDDTDSGEGIEFIITGVDPSFGPTGVTTEVVILGEGFEPDESDAYEVFFGTRRATITDVQTDAITVEVPSLIQAGDYDVELIDDDDETLFPAGFTAYTNRGNGSAANGTGAIGLFETFTHVNASWPQRQTDFGQAFFALTTGAEVIAPSSRFGPGIDQCTTVQPTPAVTTIALPDTSVTIDSDETQYTLTANTSGNGFSATGLDPVDLGDIFRLDPVGSTDMNPSLGIDPLFNMPDAVQVLRPSLGSDSVGLNGFFLGWSQDGQESGDFIAIQVEVWERDWSRLNETVYCAALDDGSFRVPPGAFEQWQSGARLNVRIGRARNIPTLLPYNRSENAAVAVHWVVGPLEAE